MSCHATHHLNKVIKAAGVPEIRFHDLRHTFASWYMIEVGDIWSLKGILGHVDIQTTQRYAHLSQSHQKVPTLSWALEKNKNFPRHFHATFRESIRKTI